MIYNQVSIKEIIRRVTSNLRMREEDIPWNDFIEWIADGLSHIGSYYQYTEKQTSITIEDYKGQLPCDFVYMIRMLHNGYYDNPSENLITDNTLQNADLDRQVNNQKVTARDYNINHNVITTSYRTGTLEIQYLAMPLDEEGYPMIPDDISYKDALFWKVIYHLSIMGYPFKNPMLSNIDWVKRKWDFYCVQARANANAPTLDTMQKLANNYLSLYPKYNQYYTMFASNGLRNILTLKGKL